VWSLFVLTFAIVTFFSITMVANLIASPFYGLLAEKTEKILIGRTISRHKRG
jgi:CysZ protein